MTGTMVVCVIWKKVHYRMIIKNYSSHWQVRRNKAYYLTSLQGPPDNLGNIPRVSPHQFSWFLKERKAQVIFQTWYFVLTIPDFLKKYVHLDNVLRTKEAHPVVYHMKDL
jgi:hypothetical protein